MKAIEQDELFGGRRKLFLCENCGKKQILITYKFCPSCGEEITEHWCILKKYEVRT